MKKSSGIDLEKKLREVADRERLGTPLLRTSHLFWTRDYLFENGMIREKRLFGFSSGKAIHHWKDVKVLKELEHMDIEHDTSMGSVTTQYIKKMNMEFHNGDTCDIKLCDCLVRTWDRNFFLYGPEDYQPSFDMEVAKRIKQKIASFQLEQMRGNLKAGIRLEFGQLFATVEGIYLDDQFFPWKQVTKIYSQYSYSRRNFNDQGHFLYISTTASSKYLRIAMSELYNVPTLKLLWEIMNSDSPILEKGTTN